MRQNRPKPGTVLLAVLIAVWVGGWRLLAMAKEAPVQVTGQTECWDASGTPIECTGTGQDGEVQAGVPFPTPRFTDQGNGTVKDNLTRLIWLKNANCFGGRTWAQALTNANTLASGSCGLTDGSVAGDWRLPNVRELVSLMDYSAMNPALPDGHPFSNVQLTRYWSSTTTVTRPDWAWNVWMGCTVGGHFPGPFDCEFTTNGGSTDDDSKDSLFPVWPVRGGFVGSLAIFPPTGILATTFGFDLGLVVDTPGLSVVNGTATFNGTDVTAALVSCLLPGTLLTGGQTFRCPGLTGGSLGEGMHVLEITLELSDASRLRDAVTWKMLANTEP